MLYRQTHFELFFRKYGFELEKGFKGLISSDELSGFVAGDWCDESQILYTFEGFQELKNKIANNGHFDFKENMTVKR